MDQRVRCSPQLNSPSRPRRVRGVTMSLLALLTVLVAGAIGGPQPTPGHTGAPAPSPAIVEVSGEGSVFGTPYAGLFDGRILVPEAAATDSFVVRNEGSSPGYVRVVLTTVVIPNRDVLDSLALSAGTSAHPGISLPVSGARPCLTLLEGQLIEPGQSVRVNSVLTLGNLTATHGQGVPIRFRLEVLLSERAGQNAVGCPVAESSPPVPDGDLAATGLTGVWGAGAVGAMLTAAGASLAVRLNRRGATAGKVRQR